MGMVALRGCPGCHRPCLLAWLVSLWQQQPGSWCRVRVSRQSRGWRLVCSPPGSPMTALPFTTSCKNLAADLGELPGPKM